MVLKKLAKALLSSLKTAKSEIPAPPARRAPAAAPVHAPPPPFDGAEEDDYRRTAYN